LLIFGGMKQKILVALGASAGGITALSEFFDNTLPDAASYVVTMHLHPDHKSILAEMLQRHSMLLFSEVVHGMEILPNQVYVMPENKVMSIAQGRLLLAPRDRSLLTNQAIDIFFESLADDSTFKIIAIVLSGYGVDGTAGIRAIKNAGGWIIAQEMPDVERNSMPNSVIATGLADLVLKTRDMPAAIIKLTSPSVDAA
jgi:two-component system CheB/CheR fusion protein